MKHVCGNLTLTFKIKPWTELTNAVKPKSRLEEKVKQVIPSFAAFKYLSADHIKTNWPKDFVSTNIDKNDFTHRLNC